MPKTSKNKNQLAVVNNGISRDSVLSDSSLSTLDDFEDYRLQSED